MAEQISSLSSNVLARQRKVRFLYRLGEDFSGFETAAMWDDAKLGLKHLSGWERMAEVSDVEWAKFAVKIFGLGIPGQVRVFHNSELGEAKRWIVDADRKLTRPLRVVPI